MDTQYNLRAMKNRYLLILIVFFALSGCTKELAVDEFTPCGGKIEETLLSVNWKHLLDQDKSLYETFEPVVFDNTLIYTIGQDDFNYIVIKRDLTTGEIVKEEIVYWLLGGQSFRHEDEMIFVELGRILAMSLHTLETRLLWDFEYSPHFTGIDEDLTMIDNRLYFTDLAFNNNTGQYYDRLISLNIKNLEYEQLYEWDEKPQAFYGVHRFKIWKNENGENTMTYLDGRSLSGFQSDALSIGRLGTVNLLTKELLFENNILVEFDDYVVIDGFEIYENQVHIEMNLQNFSQYDLTIFNSYETRTGTLLWTNEFTTNGQPFEINRYYQNRNSLIIKAYSTVHEIDLDTGEIINNNIAINSNGYFFNFGTKIGYVFDGEIRVFDPKIGCITESYNIPENILNAVTYNPDLDVLYTYTNSKFVELSLN